MIWKSKQKPLLLTIGTAVSLIAGGATAWWLILQRTPIAGLPTGADVLPQNTAVSLSFSTNTGQWRRLRQYGTAETKATVDRTLVEWRDRFFADNGINYERDIQPWVGGEITVAFLNMAEQPEGQSNNKQIQPYRLPNQAEYDQSAVMILPIAHLDRVQQFATNPPVAEDQEWADREYKGETIREVQGTAQLDYAATVLDDRFVVVSGDSRSIEQVIDTYKGEPSIARNGDYGRAFTQLQEEVANPFLRLYVNVPAATEFTTNNANQPLPPQFLTLLQNNQGLASAMTLESDGVRFQGFTWVSPNSKTRLKADNEAERLPVLLPSQTVLLTSGDNLKQFWQDYSQPVQADAPPNSLKSGVFNPNAIRQGFRSFTGLDLDEEVIPWTEGEYALALLSSPATPPEASTAGILLMSQVSDRRAAEETFKKLDRVMQEQHNWQVQEAQLEGQPVTKWTSPFAALDITRGWLDGNIVYLAIGSKVADAVIPTPTQPLIDTSLFQQATATEMTSSNGQFFLALEKLVNQSTSLPLPQLPEETRKTLSAIQAIGMTTAVQDGRTLRYDAHIVMPRSDEAPGNLPAPGETVTPSPSPAASPDANAAPEDAPENAPEQ